MIREGKRAPRVQVDIAPIRRKEATWDAFFAARKELSPRRRAYLGKEIHATVKQLVEKKQFGQIEELILAALRHGHLQPWMYEALALAMRAEHRSPQDIERAMMSLADLANSPQQMMKTANYLAKMKYDRPAFELYRSLTVLNPYGQEAYALALKIARRLDDPELLRWATLGVLRQAWPAEFREVEVDADRAARALIRRYERAGRSDLAKTFRKELAQAKERDCEVIVTWTGDADIDLLVLEPSGTICSLHNPMTTSGGVLVEDSFSGGAQDAKHEYRERYVCAQAFSGEYNLLIRRLWGKVTADTVTVEIRLRGQAPIRRQVRLKGSDAIGVMRVEQGRREVLIDEEMVAAARRATANWQRTEADEKAVYDQIRRSESHSHAESMASADDNRTRERRRQLRRRRRGAVGYRVTPTILPEGTALSATGVVSGDRRYVRITAFPFFSGIGDVTVFDVSGGQTPGAGGGSGGSGGGGGGGGRP